jgi:hypothetical protein
MYAVTELIVPVCDVSPKLSVSFAVVVVENR